MARQHYTILLAFRGRRSISTEKQQRHRRQPVRHMDYGVQCNKLMYERLITGGDITLFSISDVPFIFFFFLLIQDKFKELYEKAERSH